MKVFLHIIGWTSAILLLMQLVKIEIPPPPKAAPSDEIVAPKEVVTILKKACYDCHSNHTNWPWYSDIAPISFEVRGHVKNGRSWLNFTIWNQYDDKKKQERYKGVIITIDIKMPIPAYIMTHPEAKLTRDERELIKKWAKGQIKE